MIDKNLPATKADLEKFVTKDEFNKAISKLATKEDIKGLATKDELKKLATKEEIKKLATKEEIKKLATKEELKKLATKEALNILDSRVGRLEIAIQNQALKLLEHDQQFDGIRQEMREHRSEILNHFDRVIHNLQTTLQSVAVDRMGFERHDDTLRNHEKRITALESA